jgi:hypothetical protein
VGEWGNVGVDGWVRVGRRDEGMKGLRRVAGIRRSGEKATGASSTTAHQPSSTAHSTVLRCIALSHAACFKTNCLVVFDCRPNCLCYSIPCAVKHPPLTYTLPYTLLPYCPIDYPPLTFSRARSSQLRMALPLPEAPCRMQYRLGTRRRPLPKSTATHDRWGVWCV